MSDEQLQGTPQAPSVPVSPVQPDQAQPQTTPAAPQPSTDATGNGNAYDQMIQQLQAQNAALMQQNELLNQQVIRMVNNGAQFNQQAQQPTQPQQPAQPQHVTQADQMQALGMQFEPPAGYETPSLSKVGDMTLESLASEIGKDRPVH